jgi:hypothetical protein
LAYPSVVALGVSLFGFKNLLLGLAGNRGLVILAALAPGHDELAIRQLFVGPPDLGESPLGCAGCV